MKSTQNAVAVEPGPFVPFSRPAISEQEIEAVAEVLRSGWITTGQRAAEFEERFAEYVGATGAVALNSATAGMHLAFEALRLGPGDEVITPSMTWVSTINLIRLAGATPVFVDVDRDSLLVSAEAIAQCIGERTRAIVPVHFAGNSVEMGPIRALAREQRIAVIEDAAHAIGTHGRQGSVGSSGTSIFSFHPAKTMTTGEGGMVCSDDPALLETVRRLKFHGLGQEAWQRDGQGRSPHAEVHEPGFKYNLTDIAAQLGLGQLARHDEFLESRTSLASIYADRLAEVAGIEPLDIAPSTARHSWSLYVVRVDKARCGIDRDELMARLKLRNIGSGIHFRAAHEQRYYRTNPELWRGQLPNTEWNSARILSLPLFYGMTPADVHRVVDEILEAIRR